VVEGAPADTKVLGIAGEESTMPSAFTEFTTISVAAASRGATICAVDEINKVGLGRQRGQEPVYGRGRLRRL
jgi:hypothetical protein